ncbi:MAG: MFS transporter [Rubrimonas sp.]|uniref:MFS transporter n=1 Tax=Rubrimonas sp. TaxID=2036015 RepID=UPI002FDD4F3E
MTDAPLAADLSPPPAAAHRIARRNVAVLIWAQAILGAQMPVMFILGGLSGQVLADDKSLATLPISVTVLVSMFAAPMISAIMGRHGRRVGFLIGALFGAMGGALGAYALTQGSFAMLVAGGALTGVYMGTQGLLRFAAADVAAPAFRAKAISFVMAGGLVAAILGPEIAKWTRDLLAPAPFAGAYAAVVALNLIGALAFLFFDAPPPPRGRDGGSGRPLGEILRQPRVAVAIICAMVSYALMNMVMTSTPLAIVACGFDPDDAASVVQAHVLAMFAPSFFTGHLIARFGAERIIAVGLALLAGCAAVALTGVELAQFYAALILLGIGWNFGFIGATAMLTAAHAPEERSKVQGANDFLVFGLVAVASFSSGALMDGIGWEAVNLAMAPFLTLAGAALIWLALDRRRAG